MKRAVPSLFDKLRMLRTGLTLILMIVFSSPFTLYGADTAASAASLAEKFSSEMLLALKDMEKRGGFDEYKKERTVAKDKLQKSLETINWTEEPGKRRASKMIKLLDEFASKEADSLTNLLYFAPPAHEEYVAAVKQKLSTLKGKMLQELEESFKRESDAAEKRKRQAYPPVPSPLEERER